MNAAERHPVCHRLAGRAYALMGCTKLVFALIAAASAFSLAAAYTGEYVFGLAPCILCLYQRVPFALAIALSVAGVALGRFPRAAALMLLLCAAAFAANAGIAFYHTGIEAKWWISGVDGCRFDPAALEQKRDLLQALLSTPAKSCDQVSWRDPFLGLTMANLNVLWSAGLAVFSLLGFLCAWRKADRHVNP